MKSRSLMALILVLVGLVIGWLLPRASAEAGAGPRSLYNDDTTIVATVGSLSVTYADVAAAQPTEFLKVERQREALVQQSLARAVQIKMIEMEAKTRGVSPDDLVKTEVDDQVAAPTDEEVEKWYHDRQIPDDLSTVAPQIRTYLAQQARNKRYAEFLRDLAKRYPVETFLEPLRSKVATAGFPSKGPHDAPVTIVEFGDFQCPYCEQLLPNLQRVLDTYGDQVRFVFRQYPLPSIHPNAEKAAEASLCANDQGKFWEMHDAMYADQNALDVPSLKKTAGSLGLDRDRFARCLDSGKHAEDVAADQSMARELGATGTPALFINGRFLDGVQSAETLAAVIADELGRRGFADAQRSLEPVRVKVATEGFPSKGPADAPVTIVEFSDFQCPYCSQLKPVIDKVLEKYGDQVRLVFRNFPIAALHPMAQKAAEASLCAQEQGKFWEMHDAMFANQRALTVADLKETARSLGLDGPTFDQCLDSGRNKQRVLDDLAAGREAGVRGTPALFINGMMGSGLQRFETLSGIIDQELASAKKR